MIKKLMIISDCDYPTGGVIAIKLKGTIKAIHFIDFLREFVKFLKEDERLASIR